MLHASLVLALAALLGGAAQGPDSKVPDPQRVEAAVLELESAFKEGKTAEDRIAAIRKGHEVLDARVVRAIGKGLKVKDAGVQAAALEALGRMDHPEALEALHGLYKSDKQRLKEDEKLLPLLFKSIGRHGSEKSVEILSDDLFLQRSFPAIQARVLSLGNIRSRKSVEALMEIMTKAGRRQVNDYMNLFRQSLVRLTGTDQGPDSAMWTRWWQENKTRFEVQKEIGKVPGFAEETWNEYWGIEAREKREKRKQEPKQGSFRPMTPCL
ncbi:MAG: HEAT repeat domain-containing protein [Planctomycetota bacterium]